MKKGIVACSIILIFISVVANYHFLTEYLPHRSEFHTESAVIYKSSGRGRGWAFLNSYRIGYGPEGTYADVNGNFWEHPGSQITVAVPDGTRHYVRNTEGTDEPDTSSSYYRYPVQRTTPVITTGMAIFLAALIINTIIDLTKHRSSE